MDVAGDNELESVEVGHKATVRILCEINRHRLKLGSFAEMDVNVMSSGELGKLVQLPGAGLQDDYADQLETIKLRQNGPPITVTTEGLPLATVEIKNQSINVYMPTKIKDEFCLPSVKSRAIFTLDKSI